MPERWTSMPRLGLFALALLVAGCGAAQHTATGSTTKAVAARADPAPRVQPVTVAEHLLGTMAAPVQDATSAPYRTGAILAGGLTAGDTSTSNVVLVRTAGSVSPLPLALHDATAANLGGTVYLFGGGDGVHQLDGIIRVAPGAPATVGHLPAPSSDQAGAALNGSEYVVGGYTGTVWLNTIVRWRPGATARVVGHLPVPLRYAAVAAVSGRIVIAGGSTPAGTASSAVLSFDPATGRVSLVGRLPGPTTHAAAAALGNYVYVIGGAARRSTLRRRRSRRSIRSSTKSWLPGCSPPPAPTWRRSACPDGSSSRAAAAARGPSRRSRSFARRDARRLPCRSPSIPTTCTQPTLRATSPAPRARRCRASTCRTAQSDTVDVIDPATYKIVDHFAVGGLPQHVVPVV
jgi:hypothetical protein